MEDLRSIANWYFNVAIPTTSIELKKSYHRECIRLHPDLGGDEKEFKQMQEAYNKLTNDQNAPIVISDIEFQNETVIKTIDGISINKLGLGLGPNINGSDCSNCNHKGYLIRYNTYSKVCSQCNGTGRSIYLCQPCRGTGKFQQARSKKIVTCLRCRGKGVYSSRQGLFCIKCRGSGELWIENKNDPYYVKCMECNGAGELPVWNPVLRKGILK